MSYERWDRDRFEREREREHYDERDYYREEDYRRGYAPPRERSRGPPPVRESERIFFDERQTSGAPVPFRPRREDYRYFDERETVSGREGDMVPYRAREDERDFEVRYRRESRPFERPQFVRRQSSLDTHDRKPLPRYGDRLREEYVVPAPARYADRGGYDDIRVAEPEYYGDEEYHPYREREREVYRRRYPPPPPPTQGEEIVYEREETVKSEYPKRGKTRMPRRLINIRAIMDLGYEFEEEDKTIIILKALGKENIDDVIRISREYNAQPLPPPPMDQPVPPQGDEEIITRRTEYVRENPSLAESRSASSSSRASSPTVVSARTKRSSKTHKSHRSRRTSRHSRSEHRSEYRSKSRRRHRSASLSSATTRRELVVREPREARESYEVREPRRSRDQPHSTALVIPRHERRNLEDELHALELERKALQYEREAEQARHEHPYLVEKEYKDGAVEVKKERNGPNPKLIKAMMATLT